MKNNIHINLTVAEVRVLRDLVSTHRSRLKFLKDHFGIKPKKYIKELNTLYEILKEYN